MAADPFLHDLLHQSLDRAGVQTAAPPVRLAFARLAGHLLRETDDDLDEATIARALEAIGRNLHEYAIVVVLARSLWLTSRDESRLFTAFYRLADAAFRAGHLQALAELLSLLVLLGHRREPLPSLPDVWCETAAMASSPYGATPAALRLVARWADVFDHVPQWLRDFVQLRPGVLRALSEHTVLRIHGRAPTASTWLDLARRRQSSRSSAPKSDAQPHEVAREELALAVRLATVESERATLTMWLRAERD